MLLFAVPILVRRRLASAAAASSMPDRTDRDDGWLMWSLPVILAAWAAVIVLVGLVV